jgi:hypothetical protein
MASDADVSLEKEYVVRSKKVFLSLTIGEGQFGTSDVFLDDDRVLRASGPLKVLLGNGCALNLLNHLGASSGLPKDYAMEVAPYWLTFHPNLTFRQYQRPSPLQSSRRSTARFWTGWRRGYPSTSSAPRHGQRRWKFRGWMLSGSDSSSLLPADRSGAFRTAIRKSAGAAARVLGHPLVSRSCLQHCEPGLRGVSGFHRRPPHAQGPREGRHVGLRCACSGVRADSYICRWKHCGGPALR